MPTREERIALFERGIARVAARAERLSLLDRRLSNVRLGIAVAALIAFMALKDRSLEALAVALTIAAVTFVVVIIIHRRVRHDLQRQKDWMHIKRTHIARARIDWELIPLPPRDDADAKHPFAIDLHLTGEHSLHHLLDTASSLQGSDHLRDWLLDPLADADAILARQRLIADLSPRFCDRLAQIGRGAAVGEPRLNTQRLLDWMALEPVERVSGGFVALLGVLCLITAALFVISTRGQLPPYYVISFAVYAGLSITRARAAMTFWSLAMSLQDVFNGLNGIFNYFERTRAASKPALAHLIAPFQDQQRPSRQLRTLRRIIGAGGLQANAIAWGIANALMPWDLYFAYRLSVERRKLTRLIPIWLGIWHELEALASLRTFAHLNPGYVVPSLAPGSGGLEGTQIGHPLIEHEDRVCNDFAIDRLGKVVLITGSNMSGKSVFLRTLGVNLLLARVGAVACAESMRTDVFRLYSCIQISDSLVEGYSYFYAEVRRLKDLLDALRADDPLPLFFLIDEIFKGTNNRERLEGSRAYIASLIGQHGLGLVTTHDLELASLPGLINYHFSDSVQSGELTFDYTLRPGVSPTTNALRIMALAGLPVSERAE
ncbi:MAG: hypothetical protein IT320_19080 [Anaerolineae bacterium]|nr:hypothetical protein [Anaerolineae bacterium]